MYGVTHRQEVLGTFYYPMCVSSAMAIGLLGKQLLEIRAGQLSDVRCVMM